MIYYNKEYINERKFENALFLAADENARITLVFLRVIGFKSVLSCLIRNSTLLILIDIYDISKT